MRFEEDAFISYAHLDNVELVEGRKGWVTNLHRALELRVAQLLGKSPHIWRDPKLSGNDLFADTLIQRLQNVAILVSVVSPRYLKSEWTMREMTEFWRAAEEHGGIHVNNKARVFKVLKTPVPLDRTPPELRSLIGYEFFNVDPHTGKARELDEIFGPEAHRDFWIKLDDLAHDIRDLIEALEPDAAATGVSAQALPATSSPVPPSGQSTMSGESAAVFLAETTSDLKEQREALRRHLLQHGHNVLPAQHLSHVAEEAREAIRDALSHCRMSIHLIGRNYSLVPEGGMESLIEIQHELATERGGQSRFSRLLWIPPGVQVDDERQQRVIERLRLDPRIQGNADLLETSFEDLRGMVQEWLDRDRKPEPSPAAGREATARSVYLIADQRDAELLSPWADHLFDRGFEVIRPIFDGDEAEVREYHEETLSTCDGLLVFYGAGNELWVRRKLREVQKAPGYGRTKPPPVIGICLVGQRTPDKERFRTHEAMVMPQWEGFAPEPLASFIDRLEPGAAA